MTETVFRIAETRDDLARCQQLLLTNGYEEVALTIPSIMALREGHLVGLLGTQNRSDGIIAGPLVIDLPGDNPVFLVFQLLELYDNAMRHLGVAFYNFAVEEQNTKNLEYVERALGINPIAHKDGFVWFKREL